MSQIDPLDFLQVDRQLTDPEREIRDRVRAFVDEHVLPNIEGWFERGEFPLELSKGSGT
jgi:glutaryl-CoA dehydrogenase